MGTLLNKILGRREIMAYSVVFALILAFLLTDKINGEQFLTVSSIIVAFYFGQRSNGNNKN